MKRILTAALFIAASLGVYAQDALIPLDYASAKPEDFYRYEQNVLNCTEWLVNTPLSEREMDRKVIGQFVMIWVEVSPSVVCNYDTKLVEFLSASEYAEPQSVVYAGGYASGILKEKQKQGTLNKQTALPKGITKQDRIAGALNAVESSIEFYNRNRETIGRNRTLERYKKMQKEGTLRDYVEANLDM